MKRPPLTWLAGASVALGVTLALVLARARSGSAQGPLADGQEDASQGAPADEPRESATDPAAPFGGTLVSLTGEPVVGALLTWTPLLASVLEDPRGAPIELDAFQRVTQIATSDTQGAFVFQRAAPGAGPLGSVIWISHPQYDSLAILLGSQRDSWPETRSHTLLPSDPRVGIAVDPSGTPVAGVRILQHMAGLDGERRSRSLLERARALFLRSYVSAQDGTFAPVAVADDELLSGSLGDDRLLALPRRAPGRGDTQLRLASTFSVRGQLTGVLALACRGEIVWGTSSRSARRELGRIPFAGGSWGPERLPLLAVDHYWFRLEGPGVVPYEVHESDPGANRELTLFHEAEAGFDLWFQVTDVEHGTLLRDAQVSLGWSAGAGALKTRARATPAGYVLVQGCRAGDLDGEVTCEGYEPLAFGPIEVPQSRPTVLALRLSRTP